MTSTNNEKKERKKRTRQPAYPAPDKVQAVLAVWTERCKPVDVCRQLGINWITFNHWQRRAMEGMLQALETRVNLSRGEALSPRLQMLLANRCRSSAATKLTSRMEQINKLASPTPTPAKTA